MPPSPPAKIPTPPAAERPSPPGRRSRTPRPPLAPPRAGEPVHETPDPELDVAPNLGGESQMQDA